MFFWKMDFLTALGLQAHYRKKRKMPKGENEYNLGNSIGFVEKTNGVWPTATFAKCRAPRSPRDLGVFSGFRTAVKSPIKFVRAPINQTDSFEARQGSGPSGAFSEASETGASDRPK